MFDEVRILTLGLATVIDAVLLLAMFRPPAWRYLPVWLVLLTSGAGLWHLSTFIHALLAEASAPSALTAQWMVMLMMTAGLLLMPAAMLHGVLRLSRTGMEQTASPNYWYALPYASLLALVPAASRLWVNPASAYMELLTPFVVPYAIGTSAVNLFAAAQLWRLRKRLTLPGAERLCAYMAGIMVAMTFGIIFMATISPHLSWHAAEVWQLLVTLSPAAPALLFAYFVVRFRFMSLIVERAIVYGAVVTALLLLHRLVTRSLTDVVADRYHFDLEIVEGAAIVMLVLAYRPLRRRMAEALRYLLGGPMDRLRDETRRVAVRMSELAGHPPEELLGWFVESLAATLQVNYVAGWLFSTTDVTAVQRGTVCQLSSADAETLRSSLINRGLRYCVWSNAPSATAAEIIERADASLAVVINQQNVQGLLVVGRQRFRQQPTEEEINTLILLVEQLAGAMNNSMLQAERMHAERRALQNEKLSTLGLLAGSIAHEVKNPLSSIKTIASVLVEQLGPLSEHSEDLRLILSEVDRLSTTTSQLLDFARPTAASGSGAFLPVLDRTLHVMRHVARQHDVVIEGPPRVCLPSVSADETSLREIFFNLLSNSIDAAGSGGRISIGCRQENGCLVTEFRDTGPGIPPEDQHRLFEPFFTTKPHGTGLGLYVVARRVRELGGDICCHSTIGHGTSFVVKLPLKDDLACQNSGS
jgi:signal transduction histidine kinase